MRRLWFGTLACGLGVFVAGFITGFTYDAGWSALAPGDRGTWAGAIGTIGALLGTIWLSLSERRQRQRDEHRAATVAAAGLLYKIGNTMSALTFVLQQLTGKTAPLDLSEYVSAADQLAAPGLWEASELLPLTTLPSNSAANLAMARTMIIQLLNSIAHRDSGDRRVSRRMPLEFHSATIATIEQIRKLIKPALRECVTLSAQGAPEDLDELFPSG